MFLLSGCSQPPADVPTAPEITVLRFGHDLSDQSPQHQAAVRFSEQVKQKSKGKIQIDIYPNQSLGTDRQMLIMAQKGELDIILPPTAKLSHIIPELQIFDLPYLFPNSTTAHKALDGKAGTTLLAKFDQHDLLALNFWESGFKQLTSNKPITQISDFQNQRFRIMQSNVIRDQFSSWGADSIAIEFSKTYEALKNAIVDGQENPLNSIIDKNFHQVQKHLYLSNHGYLAQVLVLSKLSFNKLSVSEQKIIIDSAQEATQWQRAQAKLKHQQLLASLQQHPIEVSTLSEPVTQALKKKSKHILEKYRIQFGTELIELILQTIDEQRTFSDNELVIAIDADMSGNSALSGLAIRRGIEMAIDEVNQKGGVLGKTLVLTARDNSMIPARGLDNLSKFSQIDNLLAVFCGISSPVALAELNYIHQNKMLMLDPWAAATPIVDNGYQPNNVFRVSVRDEYAADFLLQNALKISPRVGLLLVDNGWGRSNHKALLSALDKMALKPTTTQWFEWGKKDFSSTLKQLAQAGSEVIIYVGNPVEASKMIQGLSQQPNPVPVISHWGITGGYFSKLTGDALNQVDLRILQTFSFIDNNKANVVDFINQYKAKYSVNEISDIVAPVGTAHAYDLTQLLIKAVKKAGSAEPHLVRDALESLGPHQGLVKYYDPPFTPARHDALDRSDFILTRYQDHYLIPISPKTASSANENK
jgi:tripartite ATP-independent transporter DctP family solute receptor